MVNRNMVLRWYITTSIHGVKNQKTATWMKTEYPTTINPITACRRVLLEKLIVTYLVIKFPTFYVIAKFIAMSTSSHY